MATAAVQVSVVIPVLNDADALARLLATLAQYPELEIVVADGGSTDPSVAVAEAAGVRVISSRPGRGQQLAAGIASTRAPWIWLLHADSEVSPAAVQHLLRRRADLPAWGRFRVTFSNERLLNTISYSMNLRSSLTGICTGDQGIFVHRQLLRSIGGVPEQSLMEDIELCRRLKTRQRPDCRPERIATSPRRWRQRGVVGTVFAMWRFRLRYWLGADAEHLAREYYRR